MDELSSRLPPFARLIGVEPLSFGASGLEARLTVPERFANLSGVMHGGAIMAVADVIGGLATVLSLPAGATTTTIESKTNFLRPIGIGEVVRITCVPLHRGRRVMVWQTTLAGGNGKPAAIVTQTQLVIPPREPLAGGVAPSGATPR